MFLMLTVMTGTAVCKVYHVVPSLESQCKDNPCITLTQFANNYSLYLETTNITLILEPGNHTFSADLMIHNISQFIIASDSSHIPVIMCSKCARTGFTNISVVHIRRIKFTGCGKNVFLRLLLENVTFMAYPEHHSSTALQLNLTAAIIIQCSFINLAGTVKPSLKKGVPIKMLVGGAIISVQSDLVIIRSTFQGNSATAGAAIFAWTKCNISILNTTFANNQAVCHDELCNKRFTVPRGGALAVQTSNLLIQSTIFNSNHANGLGGAIFTIQSNIKTIATTFF